MQSDPIGVGGGLNSYLYVKATPQQLIDPWGLCKASPKMLKCLKDIFGQDVDWVDVVVDPPMVNRNLGQGVQGAVTRTGTIYISMQCDDFWNGPDWFILHEYYHVVEQWAKGMTIFSYIFSFMEKEDEAQRFAKRNESKLRACKNCEKQ